MKLDSIEDLETYLDKFKWYKDIENDEDYDHDAVVQFICENVEMPSFYTFDEPTDVYVLHVEDDGKIWVTNRATGEAQHEEAYTNIEEAYDFTRTLGDVVFSGNVEFYTGEKGDNNARRRLGHLSIYHPETKTYRMLLSFTDTEHEWLAKSDYLSFLEAALRYLKKPDDFLRSWNFVNSHPAFWSRYKEDSNYWTTNEYARQVWVQPTKNKKGKLVFMLEAGSAVEPERTSHYRDLRLDVWAPSYNKGFVKLAALVNKFFHFDGSERENVQYEKSALEKLLDERTADLDERLKGETKTEPEENHLTVDTDVVSVFVLHDLVVELVFADSTVKAVDLTELFAKGPVFQEILDKNIFDQVAVKNGTITWPNGADIAPEVLYEM